MPVTSLVHVKSSVIMMPATNLMNPATSHSVTQDALDEPRTMPVQALMQGALDEPHESCEATHDASPGEACRTCTA